LYQLDDLKTVEQTVELTVWENFLNMDILSFLKRGMTLKHLCLSKASRRYIS